MPPPVTTIHAAQTSLWGPLDIVCRSVAPALEEEIRAQLHERELAIAESYAHPIRRMEFLGGRQLARELSGANRKHAITRGARGEPHWPAGVTGSLSHKNGLIAAACAKQTTYRGIGIDLEIVGRVHQDVGRKILTAEDEKLLTNLASPGLLTMDEGRSLAFSAKESVFKCLYPLTGKDFWFHDAYFEAINPESCQWQIRVKNDFCPPSEDSQLTGWYTFFDHGELRVILTAVCIK
jgi:4'-phosphopantetheinyl transferase EntD